MVNSILLAHRLIQLILLWLILQDPQFNLLFSSLTFSVAILFRFQLIHLKQLFQRWLQLGRRLKMFELVFHNFYQLNCMHTHHCMNIYLFVNPKKNIQYNYIYQLRKFHWKEDQHCTGFHICYFFYPT